jgi:hypothetical protein
MRSILFAILFAFMAGCVSTHTVASKSTRFEGVKFRGVAVYVTSNDLSRRQYYENLLVHELNARGIRAFSWMTIVPPADQYTIQEKVAVMAKYGLDTALMVFPAGESHNDVITGETTNCYGSGANVTCNSYNTGHTDNRMALEIKIVEYSTGKNVLVIQTQAQGGAVGIFGRMGVGNDLIEHIAGDVADQIKASRIY